MAASPVIEPRQSSASAAPMADRQAAPRQRFSSDPEPVWREIWERRELLRQLIARDVRLRYRQAVMGFLWALLMPCLVLSASLLIRLLIARKTTLSQGPNLAGTAFKAWAWAFFVGSINFTTTSLLSNINLIAKMYFPREILPMAALGAQSIDALVGFSFLMLLSPVLGAHYTVQLLWLPVLVLLLVLLILGPALLLSAANVFYRDVKYLVQVAVTFGIFATPVLYSLQDLPRKARLFVVLNPLSTVLEGLSLVVGRGVNLARTIPAADGGVPYWSPWYLIATAAFGGLLLWLAVLFFRLKSDRFSELA
jgi:lipopolysaccharide transport system permease protein